MASARVAEFEKRISRVGVAPTTHCRDNQDWREAVKDLIAHELNGPDSAGLIGNRGAAKFLHNYF